MPQKLRMTESKALASEKSNINIAQMMGIYFEMIVKKLRKGDKLLITSICFSFSLEVSISRLTEAIIW